MHDFLGCHGCLLCDTLHGVETTLTRFGFLKLWLIYRFASDIDIGKVMCMLWLVEEGSIMWYAFGCGTKIKKEKTKKIIQGLDGC